MKKLLPFLFVFAVFTGFAQHPPAQYFHLVSIGDSLHRAENFKEAAAMYNAAFTAFKGKGFVNDRYKAAGTYARIGNVDSAFYNLFRVADKGGWSEYDYLISDADLFSLHSDPRWNTLVNKVRTNKAEVESHLNKPLARELEQIFDDDQKYRMLVDSAEKVTGKHSPQVDTLAKLIAAQDKKNLARVTELLDKYGWLGADDVGRKGNQAVFHVIQHSDPVTRKKYLPMMREAVERSKAAPSELALLEDQVLIDDGKKQLYGSQVKYNDETSKYELYPLEDDATVNTRRAEMGLGPLEDYLRQWGIYYVSKK